MYYRYIRTYKIHKLSLLQKQQSLSETLLHARDKQVWISMKILSVYSISGKMKNETLGKADLTTERCEEDEQADEKKYFRNLLGNYIYIANRVAKLENVGGR